MAATVAATKAYDLSGNVLKEDLQDMIYDISPMETVFLNTAARLSCASTTHEWLTDALTAPAKNAAVEGDAHAPVARTLPSRLKNYTLIARKDIEVTGTANAVDNAGMAKLMAYHTARAGKEIKRDMETIITSLQVASAGSTSAARTTASLLSFIKTNTNMRRAQVMHHSSGTV